MRTADQSMGCDRPNSQQPTEDHKEIPPKTTPPSAVEWEEEPYSQQVMRNHALPSRKHPQIKPEVVASVNKIRLLDQEESESEQLLGENIGIQHSVSIRTNSDVS